MIFEYCGIDRSNVSENFDINFIPDTFIFMLQDILASGKLLKYRYDKDFEKPYCYACDHFECIGKTRNEALFNLLEEFCKNNLFTEEQKEELFYLISYISAYEKE